MRTNTVALSLTLVAIATLLGCATPTGSNRQSPGPENGPGTTPRPQGSAPQAALVIALRGELPSLAARPLAPFSMALYPPLYLFNAMLDYQDENGVAKPYLVEALPKLNTDTWRVLPEGKMETSYKLKPNLTWQDGTPLSAEDFVFAWKVYATPQISSATSPPIGLMEDVSAPDDRTLVIRWKQTYPGAAVMADGTQVGYQALPRHLLEDSFRDLDPVAFSGLPFWTSAYVGLGPYRVDRWEPGTLIAARSFDGYVFGKPKIDRIEIRFIPDPQTALANLLSREVQFISDFILTVTEGQTLEQEFPQRGGGTVLYSPVSLRASVVQQRPEYVEDQALLDVRVRRAIAYGIDSALAVEVLSAGKAVPTNTLTSPRVPFYPEIDKVITKYRYDPRQAQALMEEAGFAKGPDGTFARRDGQPVRFSVASSAGPKNESEVATYVDSLTKAGFEASQRILPAAQIADPEQRAILPGLQVRGGGYQLVTYTSEQIPGPNNRWRGENRGGWNSPAYDRLFEQYNTSLADADRITTIAQIEKLLTEEVPVIPHFFNAEVNAHTSALQGPIARYTPDTSGTFIGVHTWEWR